MRKIKYQERIINDVTNRVAQTRTIALNARSVGMNSNHEIVIVSPTGSGKTFMMSKIINSIARDSLTKPAFIWVSFNENNASQSKEKFEKITKMNTCDWENIKLKDNINASEVFFINWQKLVAKNKETRKLHRDTESSNGFAKIMDNTNALRDIVLVIDESHIAASTELSQEIIKEINPSCTIHLSATPNNESIVSNAKINNSFFMVDIEEVKGEKMLAKGIVLQSSSEISDQGDINVQELLLKRAVMKLRELQESAKNLEAKPLLMIQIPNKSAVDFITKEWVYDNLIHKFGFMEEEIAIWLSELNHNNLNISKENKISVLIFKQAAATGWDCPRAQVMLQYRENKSITFDVQTTGRILRVPQLEPLTDYYEHYQKSYLYSDYAKDDVIKTWEKILKSNPNALIEITTNKVIEEDVSLPNFDISRSGDYGDYIDALKFREIFVKNLIKENPLNFIETVDTITKDIAVDALLDNILDISNANFKKATYQGEDLIKLLKIMVKKMQGELSVNDKDFTNIERTWKATYASLSYYIKISENTFALHSVINDLRYGSKINEIFIKSINEFRLNISDQISSRKIKEIIKLENYSIPKSEEFPGGYKSISYKKYAHNKCIVAGSNSDGNKTEIEYMDWLERSEDCDWFFRNRSNTNSCLAIPYKKECGKNGLYYPDFIVSIKGIVHVVDVKNKLLRSTADTKSKLSAAREILKGYAKTYYVDIENSELMAINIEDECYNSKLLEVFINEEN